MLRAILILAVGTLTASALTTPLVWEGLRLLVDPVPWPFSRVFDRVAMFWVVVFLWFLRKDFRLAAVWEQLKALTWVRRLQVVSGGAALSFITAFPIVILVVAEGTLVWTEESLSYVLYKGAKAIGAAIVISLLEESFFRVLLYQHFKKHLRLFSAVLAVSAVYAVVHFIAPLKSYQYPGYSLFLGFEYLGLVIERVLMPELLPAVFGLVLVGATLCYAIEYSRSVYVCIGLHAGWVLAVKLAFYATDVAPGVEFASGVGRRYFLVAEPVAWLSVLLVLLVVWLAKSKGWLSRFVGEPDKE